MVFSGLNSLKNEAKSVISLGSCVFADEGGNNYEAEVFVAAFFSTMKIRYQVYRGVAHEGSDLTIKCLAAFSHGGDLVAYLSKFNLKNNF